MCRGDLERTSNAVLKEFEKSGYVMESLEPRRKTFPKNEILSKRMQDISITKLILCETEFRYGKY